MFGGKIAEDPETSIQQFRAIYESSPIGIEIYDAGGELVELNAACREIFGIDDLSAVKGFRLFEDPNLSDRHKQDLREGRPVQQEIVFDFEKVRKYNLYPTSKRGAIHLDLFISPLVSSGGEAVSGYVVHVRDITKRRHAEEMLLEQKRFAENVVDNSAVATFVLSPDHRVVLWNKACEELTGFPAAEMIGTSNHWSPFYDRQRPTLADLVIDKEHESLGALYGKFRRSELVPDGVHAEGWYPDMNGKDRYIVFDAAPIYDARQRLIVAIETLQDMTEFKRTGEELEKKTRELTRSNAELERFAHAASHDLKAPLFSIAGFAEVLEEKYGDRLDINGRKFLSYIMEGTDRMKRLIEDLLAYARVTTKARPLAPVDCAAVVEAAVSNLRSAVGESGARVTASGLPVVSGDETQLLQLFQNLIGNAINYRSTAPPEIRISAHPLSGAPEEKAGEAGRVPDAGDGRSCAGGGWLFSVTDNGIGIERRHFEKIFQLFQRVHPEDSAYPGTGIGLALCDKIVERHGGRIWVESEPGKGATFYFTIPG
ncbi:MAG TPA: ATP-binding protein [Nitrospirota bacterium]|nr:ATP-binding protein [Nitrospirota bacterium]